MRMRTVVGALCALGAAFALSLGGNSLIAQQPPPCDFVTGGGFIINPTTAGGSGTFGVAGGCKNGSGTGTPPLPFFGHLEYDDHAVGIKVHSTLITAYLQDTLLFDPDARLICGTAKANADDVNFVVRVKDGGEPSVNDQFDIIIALTTNPTAPMYTTWTGTPHPLAGGNIQLHKPNGTSTTGVFGGLCPALGKPPDE
ncbi:MAG TPA: post-COAP-1 domain-containing protein [Vicinamibacterales bacterium]|nr:post-COAP-1 domain-containing protein [Vicinamibacterales bacterium]